MFASFHSDNASLAISFLRLGWNHASLGIASSTCLAAWAASNGEGARRSPPPDRTAPSPPLRPFPRPLPLRRAARRAGGGQHQRCKREHHRIGGPVVDVAVAEKEEEEEDEEEEEEEHNDESTAPFNESPHSP